MYFDSGIQKAFSSTKSIQGVSLLFQQSTISQFIAFY